jgi:putative transposase
MLWVAGGCFDLAYRLLERHGETLPSPSTFKRHLKRAISPAQLTQMRKGSAAARDQRVHLKIDYAHRLHTVLLDHTELPILVVPRRHKKAIKPWLTTVMDGKTRYVLGWCITFGRPTAEEVRAALISGLRTRLAPDGETVVGGKPMRAVWDRGLEFTSALVTESCLRLKIMPVALPAYSPHLKGALERWHRFMKQDLLSPLPGFTRGPRDVRGRSPLENYAINEDVFMHKFASWIDWYNTQHVVSTIRSTPLGAWKADGTPLTELADEDLWRDFLRAKTCKVSKNGIRFDRIDWASPSGELDDVIGRTVEIRHLPHDRDFIEVFFDGEHLCTAFPHEAFTDDDQQQFLARRHAEKRDTARQQRRATRRRRDLAEQDGKLHRIERTKNGFVVRDDLLEGGDDALARLLGDTTADGTAKAS